MMCKPPVAVLAWSALLALTAPAQAASDEEVQAMQRRIQSLEAKLEQMSKLLEAKGITADAPKPGAAGTGWGAPAPAPAKLSRAELDAIKQKLARQELKLGRLYQDAFDSPGAGLQVTGYIDPVYVVNRNQRSASFLFLDQGDPYTYDHSQVGDVFLRIQKTFGEGLLAPKMDLQLAPARGNGAFNTRSDGTIFQSIVHHALATLPVSDTYSVQAGYSAGYSGYEYYESTLTHTISHNLLYDFSAPGNMVGAGLAYAATNYTMAGKVFIGNEEYFMAGSRAGGAPNRMPSVMARFDYMPNTAYYIGGSLYLGRNTLYSAYDYDGNLVCPGDAAGYGYQCSSPRAYTTKFQGEIDLGYYTADSQYNAEVDYGFVENGAWNGKQAVWWGMSGLAHHKWNLASLGRVGATLRLDYLNNSRNGGGGSNLYFGGPDTPGTDPLNGFGIDQNCYWNDVAADGNSNNGRNCKGANRYALTVALLAYPSDRWTLKAEYRHDWASLPVFWTHDYQFRRHNDVFSLQTVYSF
jgi:hypothetical protein